MTHSRAMPPMGLSSFAEYVDAPGSEQMRRIENQYTWYNDPGRFAPMSYQAAFKGLRTAVEGKPNALAEMIARAPNDTMRPHYEQLASGMERFIHSYKPTFIETATTTWSYGDLTLKLQRHIGMQIGRDQCIVLPYVKQPELTSDGAQIAWRTLELAQDRILPASKIIVLDVRRSKLFRPTRKNRNNLDCWIESQARGYVEHWRQMMDPPPRAAG